MYIGVHFSVQHCVLTGHSLTSSFITTLTSVTATANAINTNYMYTRCEGS
jgi:hypothetical protein